MTKKGKVLRFGFYAACALLLLTQSVCAYIDPATASYVIQIIVGVVIACGTVFGIFFNKIKRAFKKNKGEEEVQNIKTENDSEGSVVSADDLLGDDDDNDKKQNKSEEKDDLLGDD